MNTLRAYSGADNAMVVWVRDVDGKATLSGYTARKVFLYPYGADIPVETSGITATTSAAGRLAFTVTEEYIDANLLPGIYRIKAKGDDTVIYVGLLEVV